MSTARAKKLREQSVIAGLLKDISAKMGAFEDAVEELKILKETAVDLNDEITAAEAKNSAIISKLESDMRENKLKVINEGARSLGKVLINHEELAELKDTISTLKKQFSTLKENTEAEIKCKVEEAVTTKLEIQRMEHETQTAQLVAENENNQKHIETLNEYIKRMSEELNSQKKLTADIATGSFRDKKASNSEA